MTMMHQLVDQVLDKLDCTKKYNFISPYLKVYVEYEKKKDYEPPFVLTFYCITSGFATMISIVLPMILVTFLALLNTYNNIPTEEDKNSLEIVSALTLTSLSIR